MQQQEVFSPDLAGVVVGETAIADVDGARGYLTYRGLSIASLIDRPFMQVVWLVLFGQLPDGQQEASLAEFMGNNSHLSREELALLNRLPPDLHPMLMLQGMLPLLKVEHRGVIDGLSDVAHTGLALAAKIPSLIACWRQRELDEAQLAANSDVNFHENFLTMFTGRAPTREQVAVLDVCQILQMEHSFNAGTFAGRVCASTLAPIQSSISASVGTLFGALHGGADQAALEMAEQIGSPDRAVDYVESCLARKQKIMGMGHREYRVLDPRAALLKPLAESLCKEGPAENLLQTLMAVEKACQQNFAKRNQQIHANVDFYKGAVFYQLGIPAKYFTAIFSMSRVFGYIAHYLEFTQNPRLIRPRARYVGQ
jgi:citrate synthase